MGDSKLKKIELEYPNLMISSSLEGVITQKIVGGKLLNNSTVQIILDNGKFLIAGIAKNTKYKEIFFHRFIQVGDSLYKKASDDTIFVYREDTKYYFIQEDYPK